MRLLFSLLLLISISLHAQDLQSLEAEMAALQVTVGSALTDDERLKASEELQDKFEKAFKADEAFTYPFELLYKVGKFDSGDGAFRLFNWNIPHLDGTNTYKAFLLFPNGKYTELVDTEELTHADETKTFTHKNWYGALYYYIQPITDKDGTYYTLLGWDGGNKKTNKKVIDALVIDKRGRVELGKLVFETEDGMRHRQVFEYAKDAQMLLSYLPPKDAIVYQVLAPIKGSAEGNYAFYGPSTAYNGLRLNKGIWELEKEIDMSRPKSVERKPHFDFPDRPDLNRKREKVNPLTGE